MSTNKYTQLEAVIYSSEQHACSIIHYIPPGIYVASEEWSCSKGDWPINESSNLATQIIKQLMGYSQTCGGNNSRRVV